MKENEMMTVLMSVLLALWWLVRWLLRLMALSTMLFGALFVASGVAVWWLVRPRRRGVGIGFAPGMYPPIVLRAINAARESLLGAAPFSPPNALDRVA